MVATACITEAQSGSDIRNIETTATVSETDPNSYTINGKKMWVTNGVNADVFLVYCKTKDRASSEDYDDRFSFFLVHRDMPGVSISPAVSTLGLRGLGLTHIEFKDVKVNFTQHSIGQMGEGLNVLRNLHGYVRTTLSGQSENQWFDLPSTGDRILSRHVYRCGQTLDSDGIRTSDST